MKSLSRSTRRALRRAARGGPVGGDPATIESLLARGLVTYHPETGDWYLTSAGERALG